MRETVCLRHGKESISAFVLVAGQTHTVALSIHCSPNMGMLRDQITINCFWWTFEFGITAHLGHSITDIKSLFVAFQVLIKWVLDTIFAHMLHIYRKRVAYIIDNMLHKNTEKREKGASATGSYIKQSVPPQTNDAPFQVWRQSMQQRGRERFNSAIPSSFHPFIPPSFQQTTGQSNCF